MAAVEALSVWPVAQQLAREQRRGRYLPESTAHPGKMLPALAREAINRFTQPGDLVLDPMCGIGTSLVEATHLDRRAIGVELEPRWAALAAGNILHAEAQGALGSAIALRGDARRLGRGLLDDYRDACALILTSPPYGHSTHGHVRKHKDHVEKLNDRYSSNPDNLAHLPARRGPRTRRPDFETVLVEILAGCARMLDPDSGRLVLTASLREGTMDFINIVPRIALGVIGSGYIAAVIPQEIITGWLGPDSGWLGVLTAVIAGAATPGGPVVGFSIGAVALKAGGGAPQVIAYVIAWALFAFQRLLLWEIPFMPARFVWFRAAVSLPFPFLAAAIAMAIGRP